MTMLDLLATPVAEALSKTLLHSLWQGASVALLVALLLRGLRAKSAVVRYRTSCTGLTLMVFIPILTFAYLAPTAEYSYRFVEPQRPALAISPQAITATSQAELSKSRATPVQTYAPPTEFIPPRRVTFLPCLVVGWLVGVMLLAIRLLGGFVLSRRFKQTSTRAAPADLEHKLYSLSERLGLGRSVSVRESFTVPVPLVVGRLKPVVLLPTSALTGLTPEQLEMILAHELAHVRRNDYLVNLLQGVAETLLFYHPGVWWLSRRVREEREHCCDDLVIALCGDKVGYAHTLARLDTLTAPVPKLKGTPSSSTVLAATGGSLLKRIQRLAGCPEYAPNPLSWILGLGLLVVPVLLLGIATAQAQLPAQIEENIDAFVENRLAAWAVPGMQVAVLQDGEVTFNKGYGVADIESGAPMTADTPVPLGSASWLVNAIAALKLVEDGQLNLESTLSEVLPWVQFRGGEETELTVSDLVFGGANVRDTVRFEGTQHNLLVPSQDSDFDATSKEALIRSLMPERLRSNLDQSLHADYHYVLNDVFLALVLEAASGQSHESYLIEVVFEPLGLRANYTPKEKSAGTYRSVTTGLSEGPQELIAAPVNPPDALASVVGLRLSSRALATLLQAFLTQNERLLSKDSWQTLLTPDANGWGAGGWSTRYIRSTGNSTGQTLFANIGGTEGSEVFIEVNPETGTAYLTMTNYAIKHDRHPLYQVLGSLAVSLRILNEADTYPGYTFDASREDDVGEFYTKRMVGEYTSALGPIQLYAEGETLKGEVLGNEITFKRIGASPSLIIRSDYAPLDGLPVDITLLGMRLLSRQFAYRLE